MTTDPRTRPRIVSAYEWSHVFDVDTTGPFAPIALEVPEHHSPYSYHQGDFFFPGTPSLVLDKSLESPVVPQWGNGLLLRPNRGLPCGVNSPPIQAGYRPWQAWAPGGWNAGLYSVPLQQPSLQLDSQGGQSIPSFSVPISQIYDPNFQPAYNLGESERAAGDY